MPIVPWEGAPRPPRKWQAEALPVIARALKARKKGLAFAIMGSGKSILQAELAWLKLPSVGDGAIVLSAPRQALVEQLAATVGERCGAENVGRYYADAKEADRPIIVACGPSLPALAEELQGRPVSFMILDEAHGSEGARIKAAVGQLAPVCYVGFTATPYRSVPSESLELFDEIVFRYPLDDALRDGVLVPLRHVRFEGDDPGSVDEECLAMMQAHGEGPGIVSADTIEDAESYATWLNEHGFPAEAIHSRHKKAERKAKLARLQAGEVRALVHVSLLAEGVDLPWLRWLCLRRAVQARVRFLQELGRVLRVHPGKTEGIVMDPHLLLGKHGLTSIEAIGKALEEAANAMQDTPERDGEGESSPKEVVALDRLVRFVAELRQGMIDDFIMPAKEEGDWGEGWRLVGVSQKQVDALEKIRGMTRGIPEWYREPVRALLNVPWALRRGEASDLMDVLFGAADYKRRRNTEKSYFWQPKWRVTVETPDDDSIRLTSKIKAPR